jgi:hypothetical protein
MIERLCPAAAAETSPFSRQGGRLPGKGEEGGRTTPAQGGKGVKTFIKEDEEHENQPQYQCPQRLAGLGADG